MCYPVIDRSTSYTGPLTRTVHHHTIHLPISSLDRRHRTRSNSALPFAKKSTTGVSFCYLLVHFMDWDVPASMVTEASMLPCIFIPTITNEARRHRPHLRHLDTKTKQTLPSKSFGTTPHGSTDLLFQEESRPQVYVQLLQQQHLLANAHPRRGLHRNSKDLHAFSTALVTRHWAYRKRNMGGRG